MKKLLSISLIIALLMICFAGCGGSEKKKNVDSSSGKPVVIQLAFVDPEDSSLGQACANFKTYVERESNSAMKVNLLPNSQYGGDRQAVEGCAIGTIQMTAAISSVLTAYNNDWMILDMPFIFDSKEASYAACDGALGEKLNSELPENGLIGLGFNDNGFRHITNNKKPVNEPADMKGIKIRVMESPVYMTMFQLMGANPTPMSFSEVYTALQQGTIDAQENGPVLVYTSKFNEVQKYYSLTQHVASINAVVANKTWFEGLSEEQQKILADGVRIELVDNQRKLANEMEADCLQKLKDAGMAINEVTSENHQKFRDIVKPMYDEYKTKFDPALFDLVNEANEAVK